MFNATLCAAWSYVGVSFSVIPSFAVDVFALPSKLLLDSEVVPVVATPTLET